MKFTVFFIATALVSVHAFAFDGIKRVDLSPSSKVNIRMLDRALPAIDGSINNCLVVENICYQKVKDFQPLKIRSQGKWNEAVYVGQILKGLEAIDQVLHTDGLTTIQDYSDFTVKNFAMDDNRSFVAEVQFAYGPALQTIYVFGDFKQLPGGRLAADVSRYSDLDESQRQTRIKWKRFDNYVNPNRDFRAEIAQVGMEDVKRAEAVGNVVAAWVSATGFSVAALKSSGVTTASAIDKH